MSHTIKNIRSVYAIDDSEIDNFILKRLLKIIQYEGSFYTYTFARLALLQLEETIKNERLEALPEVIFLDINMPDMNGFDFMDELNKLPADVVSKMNIIIVSSSENLEDHKRAKTYSNVINFISKPLDELKLLNLQIPVRPEII